MNDVFLDTVGILAVWDRSDQWHAAADSIYQDLAKQQRGLTTTTLVLWECGNAAARRPYRKRVNVLRQRLIDAELLIEPTADEIEAAWISYDRGEAGAAGIVDHVSFLVMRRLELTDAFTNDRHFEAAGFKVLF
jgi:predicted nucleic acid-binding protein